MSILRVPIILEVLLASAIQLHSQDPSQHAREAVRIIHQLRTIPLPNSEFRESGPPARVPNLLRQLNRELRDLIVAVLNDPRRDTLADESMVTKELKAAGWGDISRSRWNAYGEISNIDFEWRTDYDPPLLVVDTELWVPCGSSDPDSTIYIFQKKGRNWELILTADADYDSAGTGSDDAMQDVLSPPDENGKWFLAIANTPPNCPGQPTEVRFRLMRPGPSPELPKMLLNRSEPIDSNFDLPFKIAVDQDKFSIMLGMERRLDGETGISISRFDVQGDQASRVPPLALRPEDFLDEWVKRDWSEVALWSGNSAGKSLEEWHSTLNGLAPDSTEMEFVQICPRHGRDENSWLIGLRIDRQQNRNSLDEMLYVAIDEKMGAFYIDEIEKTRPAGCPGNTRASVLPEAKLPSW